MRRLSGLVAAAAAVAVAFAFVLPRIASYGAVWRVTSGLSAPWIAALVAMTAANIVTFAPPWMVALPGLGFLNAVSMTQASTAFSSVVPGGAPLGMAASFGMLRSWGFESRPTGLAVTVTGIWNQASVFLFPVVAAVLLAAEGAASRSVVVVALTGVAVLVLVAGALGVALARPELAHRAGELAARIVGRLRRALGRPPAAWGGESFVRFREETLALLRHRWIALTVATIANQLTGYLMLELSLRAVGISYGQVSAVESFAAWSIGRVLVSLPLTPGGVGFVELGLSGTLVAFGGPRAEVVAAVLIYRVLSLLPTILLGLVAAATWRRQAPERGAGAE